MALEGFATRDMVDGHRVRGGHWLEKIYCPTLSDEMGSTQRPNNP